MTTADDRGGRCHDPHDPPESARETDEVIAFGDCLADPGELSTATAIAALSLHWACPAQCQVQGRALDTLDKDYGHPPTTAKVHSV